jgi:hypothetical protein
MAHDYYTNYLQRRLQVQGQNLNGGVQPYAQNQINTQNDYDGWDVIPQSTGIGVYNGSKDKMGGAVAATGNKQDYNDPTRDPIRDPQRTKQDPQQNQIGGAAMAGNPYAVAGAMILGSLLNYYGNEEAIKEQRQMRKIYQQELDRDNAARAETQKNINSVWG